jgi:hypothetical protein
MKPKRRGYSLDATGRRTAWTATNGTAARMIGRLLEERERLLAIIAAKENLPRI